MIKHYRINEQHEVSECEDFEDWLDFAIPLEDHEEWIRLCQVGNTHIDSDCEVSTVFLRGMDNNLSGHGPPVLFETMVFGGGEWDGAIWRYATWAEAAAGHQQAVDTIMAGCEKRK